MAQSEEKATALDAALGVVDLAARAAQAYGRDDLAARLAQTRARITSPDVRVLVVGEFKQGKSSIVNALVGAPICPVDDDVATAVPTVLRHAQEPFAKALREARSEGEEPVVEDVPAEDLAAFVSEAGNAANARRLLAVEVGLPRRLLAEGLVLVDTPGVGGLGSAHTAATIRALPTADAVLFVSDASQELTEPEMEFLALARRMCPTIVSVLTKIDFYPEWRKILDLDREHLERAGFAVPIVPVSSVLRDRAVAEESRALNEESGYASLVAFLRERVVGAAEHLALRSAAHDVLSVVGQIEETFTAEHRALTDPQATAALVARLEEAKARSERLRGGGARWQQTLGDGVTDFTTEVDHDFRTRTRALIREAEEAIDKGDPAKGWEELVAWLQRRAAADIGENYALLAQRARELSARVAEHFGGEVDASEVSLEVAAPEETIRSIQVTGGVKKSEGFGSVGLTLMRGTQGGLLTFSMFASIAGVGISLTNPIMLGLGLLMGGKTLKDQKQRELAGRRQQAKAAVRKYVDELNISIGKDSRDTLRRVQRELRDTFSARAEEIFRSASESLAGAQRALQQDQATRGERAGALEAELGKLAQVRRRANALAPGGGGS